jgi:hypothetical protein
MALIPTVGHNGIAAAIVAAGSWYLAIGTGSGAEAAGNTTLTTEITTNGGARASVTPSRVDNVVTWTHEWTFTGGFTVTEIGLLDDDGDPAGNLVIRHLYSASKAVVSGDKLQCTLTMTC